MRWMSPDSAVQFLARHGFHRVSPQPGDATHHGHDRFHKLEGALAGAAGVECGGPGPSQRLSTPPPCHTRAAPCLLARAQAL